MKNIIFEVQGGIGKNIMATAVISNIKRQYPNDNILVLTAFPSVFLNNPDIYRVFGFNHLSYFYYDYIKDQDVLCLCAEPYRSNGFLLQNMHLIESWCNEISIIPNSLDPQLYLTHRELRDAQKHFVYEKPILMFQPFGGSPETNLDYSWNRDIPPEQAQGLATHLSNYYTVIQPIHEKQIRLENCLHFMTNDIREMFCLIKIADKILAIDSCVQHAAKALNKQAVVCWITNKPKVFGYNTHINILANKFKTQEIPDSVILEYDFSGSKFYDYPYVDKNVFDINEILNSLK